MAAEDEAGLLGKLAEGLGRHVGAREGLARVTEALQLGAVGTLVLTEQGERTDRELAYGPAPTDIALEDAPLRALGIDEPDHARAVDVLVRAAVCEGAEVAVVTSDTEQGLRDGVAAVLRFDVAA